MKTSVWTLAVMCVFFVLGTIFPQTGNIEDYQKAGGKFIAFVNAFSLLQVFTSPLFLFLAGLLSVNLMLCIFERFRTMRQKQTALHLETLANNPGLTEAGSAKDIDIILSRLKKTGFRRSEHKDNYFVFTKGLPYWWLSWIYHLGIVFAVAGFLLTALCSFEKEVVLHINASEKISLYNPETRLNKYLKGMGFSIPLEDRSKEYVLMLKDFKTEYYQSLKFDFPKTALERLKIAAGIKSIAPGEEAGLSPKMWMTALEMKTPEGKTEEALLRVNQPFRHKGLTLYQMGFEQKMQMTASGMTTEIQSTEPFEIPGLSNRFIASIVKTGTVLRKDSAVQDIEPFFELFMIAQNNKKIRLERVFLDREINISGVRLIFRNLKEGSGLSYRIDPGVPFIEIAALLVLIGLLLRCMGYWYRVFLIIKDGNIFALVSTRGLLANKNRILKNLLAR